MSMVINQPWPVRELREKFTIRTSFLMADTVFTRYKELADQSIGISTEKKVEPVELDIKRISTEEEEPNLGLV
tara:strand:- start:177 stop:395 length:219 start_codon:yes stop_codon:yes gene_type:complete